MWFLEYERDHVKVFDIVNEKIDDAWVQKVGMYKKIRISADDIRELLEEAGFGIDFFERADGVITAIGKKAEST